MSCSTSSPSSPCSPVDLDVHATINNTRQVYVEKYHDRKKCMKDIKNNIRQLRDEAEECSRKFEREVNCKKQQCMAQAERAKSDMKDRQRDFQRKIERLKECECEVMEEFRSYLANLDKTSATLIKAMKKDFKMTLLRNYGKKIEKCARKYRNMQTECRQLQKIINNMADPANCEEMSFKEAHKRTRDLIESTSASLSLSNQICSPDDC